MKEGRILIVDDQEANVRLLEVVLERAGYTDVAGTTDPTQAAPMCADSDPDVILLDLAMPGLDGFEVMRRIREEDPPGTYRPILVLTSENAPETKTRALSSGANDFLTKPFNALEVLLRVGNLIETRRLHVEIQRQNRLLEERVRERTAELEQALEKQSLISEQLREADRMKEDFLTSMSHEIRTPLTVVLGMSSTLERRLHELRPDQLEQLIGRLHSSARTLHGLLLGLLDVDRVRRGLVEPLRKPADLYRLVERVVEGLPVKGHPLDVNVESESLAPVDSSMVERILENLLINAFRHTPEGTPIWLSVSAGDDGVMLRVEDAGPGVPDRIKEAIFETFGQGRVPEHAPGLGLGLSLVSLFARLHGGRAWVEDREGGGAVFRVWLPSGPVSS